jgi:DNA-binding NarL/FixJ family response regulator
MASSRRRRAVVCLLSANPLALAELQRMVARCPIRVKASHFDLSSGGDVHDIRVPNATVYVLDSWSTGPVTEAVVSNIGVRHASARIIAVVPRITDAAGFSLLQLGVRGLIPQKVVAKQLCRAVVTVAGGGMWMPRSLISGFLDRTLRPGPQSRGRTTESRRLSLRERQVLDGVLKSLSNKEISTDLHISESTVKFHMNRLFQKFGVRRRSDLILQSLQETALVH